MLEFSPNTWSWGHRAQITVSRRVANQPRVPIGTAHPGRVRTTSRVTISRGLAASRAVSSPQCILEFTFHIRCSRAELLSTHRRTRANWEGKTYQLTTYGLCWTNRERHDKLGIFIISRLIFIEGGKGYVAKQASMGAVWQNKCKCSVAK